MKALLLFFLSFIALLSNGQQKENVVHWSFSSKKISAGTYEIHLTATIDEGWHVYSQTTPKDGPSLPTNIVFNKNPLITLKGKPKEAGKMITKHEEILDVNLKYYKERVDFVQVVALRQAQGDKKIKTNVSGTIEFMACTDERCLLPETVGFNIAVSQ